MGLESVMNYKNGRLVKTLCVLGAVIALVEVILGIALPKYGPVAARWADLPYPLGELIFGFICIFVCIILLAAFGILDIKLKVVPSWLVIFIFGIIIALFGGLWGGVLILIGSVIAIIDAL